jgi:outer membrane protein TolC
MERAGVVALISKGVVSAFVFGAALVPRASAETGDRLTLVEAEARSISNSPRLKAIQEDVHAAGKQAEAQRATLYPRLSLDASFRYVTEVPSVRLGPNTLPFGDNESYSLGPVLSATLWDRGSRDLTAKGLVKVYEARQNELEAAREQVLLSTRIAYAQTQLTQMEMRYVDESLQLARTQGRDIEQRQRAGAASRLDLLNSRSEILSYELRAEQARMDYLTASAELASWVGSVGRGDGAVELDSLDDSATEFLGKIATLKQAGPDHPQLAAQERIAEGLEQTAKGQEAAAWPTVQLQAKTSLDYPNGPNLEQIHQNTLSLNLTWPLIEWGRTASAVEQKRAEAQAARYRREQTEREFQRDWLKAMAHLLGLARQRDIAVRAVSQSAEIAKLRYESYKAGKISLIDVQAANLRLLDARVQKARIEAQAIAQYQTLRYQGETP